MVAIFLQPFFIVAMFAHPKNISISDYSYTLPSGRIALNALEERDAARLLVYDNGNITDSFFNQLPGFLPEDALVIFNETKVIHARLAFKRHTGAVIEIFCLQPAHQQILQLALQQKKVAEWTCLIGGKAKWKEGEVLNLTDETGLALQASWVNKEQNIVRFTWSPDTCSFALVLQQLGAVPLPPYIKRKAVESDAQRYQTIFAQREGSVAAPTASLHFTPALMKNIAAKGIKKHFTTLHVGAGTFAPVKSAKMEDHPMHEEWISVEVSLLDALLAQMPQPIIATGTTTLRTLESLFWMGNDLLQGKQSSFDGIAVSQWTPYETRNKATARQALTALRNFMHLQGVAQLHTRTKILIAPGYEMKVVDGLITNFHQPNSTLLLLVAAFVGADWQKIYQHALAQDYRFLSYGDGSLLWKQNY